MNDLSDTDCSAPELTDAPSVVLSVVIPCYNHGEFLLEAIASVESCGGRHWEIVIVNDGSTERATLELLETLRIRGYCIVDQVNQGLSAARNAGINRACGRYILPLDADNCVQLPYLTRAIEVLDQYPDVGVVYGNLELFGEQSGIVQVPRFSVDLLLVGNAIDACAVFRRSIWNDLGGYDSQIPGKIGYEDWDFWLGALERGWKFWHLEDVGFSYRCRPNSMVSSCNIPENRSRLFQYICAKHAKLYISHFPSVFGIKEAERLQALELHNQVLADFERARQDLEMVRNLNQCLADRQVSQLAELEWLRQQNQQVQEQLNQLQGQLVAQQQQLEEYRAMREQIVPESPVQLSRRSRLWQRFKKLLKFRG